tara:strand:- start:248 stop:661 length:414 start_codon:yes stop_codon:yes gene_type:complete
MKSIFIFLIAFSSTLIYSQKTSTSIQVSVNNVPGSDGTVQFGLYSKDNFMVAPPLQSATGKIEASKTTVTFNNVAPGEYAVLCYYDKNDNKQMDFEENGMPTESYGASNNIMSMGPPQWSDAKFEVKEAPIMLEIRL